MADPRSAIPSVDRLVGSTEFAPLLARYPRARVVEATRSVVTEVRARLAQGSPTNDLSDPGSYVADAERWLLAGDVPSLRPVINATGVVLHTNLGRAPLARAAVEAMTAAAIGYTNVEFDLEEGSRGSRYVHCVALLTELTGAQDALVVNNAAGALVLALNTLAAGRSVAVSRGELVEIGGGFRIPEILERSGASLIEVGSTNRTRVEDYRGALSGADVPVVLKVHRSNFRITGFTEEASVSALSHLAHTLGGVLVHDLGSGLLVDPARIGLPSEPRPRDSLEAGADLVIFSADKLLGGPQGGVLIGRADLLERARANPMCRALRVDKVTIAGLEATLRLYRDADVAVREVPVLAMLAADPAELAARSERLAAALAERGVACRPVKTSGAVGGGTFPGTELASRGVELDVGGSVDDLAKRLRDGDPPVVGRIAEGKIALDVRTVLPGQEEALVRRVVEAVGVAEESPAGARPSDSVSA